MIHREGVSKKKQERQTFEAFIMLTDSEKSEIIRAPNFSVSQAAPKSMREHSWADPKKGIETFSAPPSEQVFVQSPPKRVEPALHNNLPPEELCSLMVRTEAPDSCTNLREKDSSAVSNHLLRASFCKPVQPSSEEEPIYPSVSIIKSGNDINLAQSRDIQKNGRRFSSTLGFGIGSIPVFQLVNTFEENTTPKAVLTDTVIREEDNRNLQIDTNVDLSCILKNNPQFQKFLVAKYGPNPSLKHIQSTMNGLYLSQPKHTNQKNETGLSQGFSNPTKQ